MSYDPNVKVYYGDNGSSSDRLIPAPQISFSTELVYANDTVAGYSYIVSLNGYATALDLSAANVENSYGLTDVSDAVNKIRKIMSLNSGSLYVVNKNNDILMECRGGIIRSINFDESPNNWVNYVPYKVEIEFNEILLNGCSVSQTISCTDLTVDSNSIAPNLIDVSKYKIKSFNDNWSFNISDQAYNNYGIFQNQYIDIEYTISATGKHFYTEDRKTLPAWEQAKNFVQDRLNTQVKGLISSILNRSPTNNGCSAAQSLPELHSVVDPGSLDGISESTHKIYNETVSCESSEAEGTFSATYKSILKYSSTNTLALDCIHTFTKSKSVQNDNKTTNVNLSIQGNITGLIPGGLINSPNIISLPDSGKLFISYDSAVTKYDKALSVFNTTSTGSDLSPSMKSIVGVNHTELLLDNCASNPRVSSFSATHDYTNGTISYSAEYNTKRGCSHDSSYRNISITVENNTPMVVEFMVPGRQNGPIIQRLGVNTSKKINVNIEGISPQLCCTDLSSQVEGICNGGISLASDIPSATIAGLKLIQNQETYNAIDGSYVISRSYIDISGA
jgi:hypothetical protein